MRKMLAALVLATSPCMVGATESLNVFTWDGYVQPEDVAEVNAILKAQGYDIEVKVIDTLAEGPQQMYDTLRTGTVDIAFLTLNYINMEGIPTANLLQPIDTDSPRLPNYRHLSGSLTRIGMGMDGDDVLYIPWGGGAYGIWANMDKIDTPPARVADLLDPQWKGKLSLTLGQVQPNIALALLAAGKPPFDVNDVSGDRAALQAYSDPNGELQGMVTALYAQVGHFWDTGPEFRDDLLLVASYGPGASAHNAEGNNWQMVRFEEGSTVWLDTINFARHLNGEKLEAAEIFANHFIGKDVQERVVNGLGMVAASTLVDANPLIEANPDFYDESMFWPPYTKAANNLMELISKRALQGGS
ncbi:extracellular solute-binding protein [Rhodovulum tesquicola]|uniref:ABC transporter substrate-binding protein n=1 Tax=Rhodovulum tesquicola TaxID=540254 RepID=UPI002097DE54|nr:extracellular solute-binding protein [Rhodovulum tesquicola]MCO8146808.1 extracellular solute-binding protein [Rhodovulum tesquicola]